MKQNENIKKEKPAENKSDKGADKGTEKQHKRSEKDQLSEKLTEVTTKLEEATDKYIRLAAEFDNFRRRTAKERLDMISTAGEDVIKGFLPTLDDCERAIQVLNESDAADAAKEGTELILNKLLLFLRTKGVVKIEAMGALLDTDFHEAVAQVPVQEEDKKNKIIDIIQNGYTMNGKVIRFAKVVVGA